MQNWEASTAGGTDTTDLVTAVVAGDQGNLRAEGPDGALPAATPFDIRTFWDESDHGRRRDLARHADPRHLAAANEGDIGVIPVTVNRVDDDVTKSADVTEAAPGDTITYTVDVAPNVTREDLDLLHHRRAARRARRTSRARPPTVPTFADGVVSWSGDLAVDLRRGGQLHDHHQRDRRLLRRPCSGRATSTCASPGINARPDATIVGDTKTFTRVRRDRPFGFYGEAYKGLSFTDDGFLVYGGAATTAATPWLAAGGARRGAPNNVAAVLWQDMEFRYDAATGAGVAPHGRTDGLRPREIAIIEYDNMRDYGDAAGADGRSTCRSSPPAAATTWCSSTTTSRRSLLADPEAHHRHGERRRHRRARRWSTTATPARCSRTDLVVCATYSEPEAEGASFTYQVTVDADVVERQGADQRGRPHDDDPGAKPVSASHTVDVKGAAERTEVALSLDPDRIETGRHHHGLGHGLQHRCDGRHRHGRVLGGHPPGRHRHARRRGQGHGHADGLLHRRDHPGHGEVPR